MAQTVCILLSLADRDRLLTVISDRNRPHKHVERAHIVLASAEYRPVQQIAQQLGVSRPMVWRWQQRFAEHGVDGLLRDKTRRPGKAPIDAETVAQVVALTCGQPVAQPHQWVSVGTTRSKVPTERPGVYRHCARLQRPARGRDHSRRDHQRRSGGKGVSRR